MYLVELRLGKEELYRSVDELAIAIRSGSVDTHSRIFHRATSKWISVTLHPQYKAIAAELSSTPPPPVPRKNWTFLQSAEAGLEPTAATAPAEAAVAARNRPWWRRPLGLGVAALCLLAGLQLARTSRPPWAGESARVVAERPTAIQADEDEPMRGAKARAPQEPVAWSNVGYPVPRDANAADARDARARRATLPRAPRVGAKPLGSALRIDNAAALSGDVRSVAALVARYDAAYDSALTRLETGTRVARVDQLFSPARLSPSGGVRDTRMSLAGMSTFVRDYRKREATLERAYADSFATLSRRLAWTPAQMQVWKGRAVHRERPEVARLTASLLSGIDSLFGVLDAQAGAYHVQGDRIGFENAAAGKAYGALRQRVETQIRSARASDADGGAAGVLIEAVGALKPPRER